MISSQFIILSSDDDIADAVVVVCVIVVKAIDAVKHDVNKSTTENMTEKFFIILLSTIRSGFRLQLLLFAKLFYLL